MDRRILAVSCGSVLTLAFACSSHGAGGASSVEYFGDHGGAPVEIPSSGGDGSSENGGVGGSDQTTTVPEPPPPPGDDGGAVAGTSTTVSGTPPTGAPGPRFIGRFTSDHEFAWSGTAIELRFRGSELSVTLDDWGHNFFEIILDGEHQVIAAAAGPNTYQLASGLGPEDHEVLIYRRTEGFFGPSRFLGFSVPQSEWLPSRTPPERRIEIVADSTAVGYGIDGNDPTCPFAADTEDSSLAYGELTGKALDAEVSTIGWSGIGVYRDYSGNTENTMGLRYDRALPTEDGSSWDFNRWVPQVVVVNLGSNDFVQDDPGPDFEAAYHELLDQIRSHYPDVRVYCAVGSSLFDSEYPRLRPRIEAIVADRAAAGEDIAFMDFGTTTYDDSYACDWHPSRATHEAMAAMLTQALQQDLGW